MKNLPMKVPEFDKEKRKPVSKLQSRNNLMV
jgi:hypothetical protein